MNNVQPTYVTSDQVKKLKEKKFYEEDDLIVMPEQWEVIEWLRVNHKIWIAIDVDCRDFFGTDLLFFFRICSVGEDLRCLYTSEKYFETPEEATSTAIDITLNNLI